MVYLMIFIFNKVSKVEFTVAYFTDVAFFIWLTLGEGSCFMSAFCAIFFGTKMAGLDFFLIFVWFVATGAFYAFNRVSRVLWPCQFKNGVIFSIIKKIVISRTNFYHKKLILLLKSPNKLIFFLQIFQPLQRIIYVLLYRFIILLVSKKGIRVSIWNLLFEQLFPSFLHVINECYNN